MEKREFKKQGGFSLAISEFREYGRSVMLKPNETYIFLKLAGLTGPMPALQSRAL